MALKINTVTSGGEHCILISDAAQHAYLSIDRTHGDRSVILNLNGQKMHLARSDAANLAAFLDRFVEA